MPSIRFGRLRTTLAFACLLIVLSAPPVAAAHGTTPGATAVARSGTTTCGAATGASYVAAAESGNLSLETFVAPGEAYDRLADASALETARRTGTLTPADGGIDRKWVEEVVAYHDVIVHRIALNGSASGLLDRLDESSPSEDFRGLAASDDVDFEYRGATACPPELALNASVDRGAVRVVPDRADDTLYLVLDTDRLLFHPLGGGEPTTDTYVKGHHGISFGLRAESGLVPENRTVANDYQVEDADAAFAGRTEGLLRLSPTDDETVRGRTLLAPGSEVSLSLRPLTANASPVTGTATVDRSREFAAGIDLSDASDGAVYTVELRGGSRPVRLEGGATLVVVGNASGAVVDARDQSSEGKIFYGPSLTTTDGGFAVVRNASGGFVGASEHLNPGATSTKIGLAPDLAEDQTVTVIVYRDANGNEAFDDADVPYRANGTVVQDTAAVRVERRPKTTTTSASSSTATFRPASSTATPGQPGFGVTVALIAVIAAGLLATKRRG